MPRLLPSFGRSSKEHARGYTGYDGYDAPHGYYDGYGYEEQEPQTSSAWRKVFPKKLSKRNYAPHEQIVPYRPPQDYRPTVEDYPEEQHHTGMIPTDDTSSFENIFAASDSAVPLVQRESSLARIGNAFADRPGLYAPTMSAVPSASHGAPFYAPQPIPAGQPHLATVNNMHAPPVVANPPAPLRGSVHADVVHHSASFPPRAERSGHRSGHRRRERERSEPPRVMPSRDHAAYWDRPLEPEEEPPVVVVVEHGKNGKKDKYYIIPGGAPVIFEDEDGNELTRVGDFSGRYQPPRKPRPVIVQDHYGREICRAGFNDDRVSVGSRSIDEYSSYHSESGRSHHRGRTSHCPPPPPDAREHGHHHAPPHDVHHSSHHGSNQGSAQHAPSHRSPNQGSHHGSHHSSPHSSSRGYAADSYVRDPHYQPSRGRAASRTAQEDIAFVDPRATRSDRSGHSSDTLVRSSNTRHDDRHGRSRRDYVPDERDYSYRRDYRRE